MSPFYKYYFKLKIIDKRDSNFKGPAVYVGNHESFLDAFMLNQALSKEELKNFYYLGTKYHFSSSFRKKVADNSNLILIDLNKNTNQVLEVSKEVLKNNKNLLLFPEGARSKDGNLQNFKKSFALIATELKVPVVPFAIDGAYEALPYGKKFPRRTQLNLTILSPISSVGKSIDELVDETVKSIKNELN